MPTVLKPPSDVPESVWLSPSAVLGHAIRQNRAEILERLGFYREHGRPGDFDGKFDDVLRVEEDIVIERIVGVMTCAADRAAALPIWARIGNLKKVIRNPRLLDQGSLPYCTVWDVADYYQRDAEEPGTHFADVMGFKPDNYEGNVLGLDDARIIKAATAAIEGLQSQRPKGRPLNLANEESARGLTSLFIEHNPHIRRSSVITSDDKRIFQREAGAFHAFVEAVIPPLQQVLRERNLAPVTTDSIVRRAAYPISPISYRFQP